jgi:RNA 2',3'-cyclic 3'-phosphodiesterase
MRAFIAIDLPQAIKKHLSQLEEKLQTRLSGVKWVEPANIHITLKFLGEIDTQTKTPVSAALNEIAAETAAFPVRISSAGAFPDTKYPRIVWLGASQGNSQAGQIAAKLEESMEKLGFARENREFSCHLTIARVKQGNDKLKLAEGIAEIDRQLSASCLEFTAEKITLFKSTLSAKGPLYEKLHEANLKTS